MGFFKKKPSSSSLHMRDNSGHAATPIPPPPTPKSPVKKSVFYTVLEPWRWVMKDVGDNCKVDFTEVEKSVDLPTGRRASMNGDASTPTAPSGRRRRRKPPRPCILRLEMVSGESQYAAHGTSEAFDGLEDKDELVRTIQRCRCEHLEISPPSKLINWDATKDECVNLVGDSLPTLTGQTTQDTTVAVLKEPMGSQGKGIFFVQKPEEIHDIIEEHRKRAAEEPEFLDNLIAAKGRIPSWVLQAEVQPCLLVRDNYKFHIRTYVVGIENLQSEDALDLFIFNRHEVRIAKDPVSDDNPGSRKRSAHITNGIPSDMTERELLDDMPELAERNLKSKIELFVARAFVESLMPDMLRRVSYSASQDDGSLGNIRKFTIAGLDLMVTQDERLYLLEVNVNPKAPPRDTISEDFGGHLVGFMNDLVRLVTERQCPNFIQAKSILNESALWQK